MRIGINGFGRTGRATFRAAYEHLVPTFTGAAKAVGLVIPELLGRMHGFAVRFSVHRVTRRTHSRSPPEHGRSRQKNP